MSNISDYVLRLGALALVIQNIMLFFGFVLLQEDILRYAFYLDMIGFAVLGLAYLGFVIEKKHSIRVFLGALAIIGWVVARYIWNYVLTDNFIDKLITLDLNADDAEALLTNYDEMINAFLIGAVLLLVGFFLIWSADLEGGTFLFAYSIFNLIGVFLVSYPILFEDPSGGIGFLVGAVFKIIFIPIVGIIAFAILFGKAGNHFRLPDTSSKQAVPH